MGRKTWVKPMTLVQKFEANEPVAAIGQCYQILCKSDAKAGFFVITDSGAPEYHWSRKEGYFDSVSIEGGFRASFKHDQCKKSASNNVFNVDVTNPSNPIITYVTEVGGNADEGAFEHWLDYSGDGKFGQGDIIYWTNVIKETPTTGMRYNHWGEVASVDSSRPLHS